jgi:hypothetical protein
MRISLATGAGRACFAATLVFSLGLSPSFARMGGSVGGSFARPAFGMGHFSHFAPRGFNRPFEVGHFGFNRFGRFGPNRFDRFGFNHFNRFAFNRFGFNRFGFDRFGENQLLVGGWGWGGWGGWGGYSAPAGASEPIIVGDRAPVVINIGVDPAAGDGARAYSGGCVVHKLNYDGNGKYVGERQIPLC